MPRIRRRIEKNWGYGRAFLWIGLILLAAMVLPCRAQVTTTKVSGTVYFANGSPASGSLIVTWPAFTTSQGQAIAAGSLSAAINADGNVSLALAPNQNATPSGTFYTAIYHLSDGSVNQEYWVVPPAASATIAQVRTLAESQGVAAQSHTQNEISSVVQALDQEYLPLSGGTMTGPLVLDGDPVSANQAATKHYVDASVSAALNNVGANSGGAAGPETRVNVLSAKFSSGQPIESVSVTNGACTSNPTVSFPAPQFSSDGSQAEGVGICANGKTEVYVSFPGGGYTASQVPTITGGGTSGATGTLVLMGTQNSADPTGENDSTAPIQNAIDYAQANGISTSDLDQIYIPGGTYKLTSSLILPCDLPVTGDGENATILEPNTGNENGITLWMGNHVGQPDAWSCTGSIKNLTIYTPLAHNYTATLLSDVSSVGYTFANLVLSNSGGRGLALLDGPERNLGTNISINTTAWPAVLNGNENHWRKFNIADPGQTGDQYCYATGFTYISNCVNGQTINWSWQGGSLVSASANNGTATFYVRGSYTDSTPSYNAPIVAGLHFSVSGTTGTVLDGTYSATAIQNDVTSDPSGNCSTSNPCFEVQAASSASGTAVVSSASWDVAVLPDRNAAVYLSGADDVFDEGSIKTLWHAGGIDAEAIFGGKISSIYFEGYPTNGGAHLNSAVTAGNVQPRTTLTAGLPSQTPEYTVVPVASSLFFPGYVNNPLWADQTLNSNASVLGVQYKVACPDYQYGNTSPCAQNPNVNRNMYEIVQGIFSRDGFHVYQRDLAGSTAPAGTAWPAGSIIAMMPVAPYPTLEVSNNHMDSIDTPGTGWSADCDDQGVNICAAVIVGGIPDYLTTLTPGTSPRTSYTYGVLMEANEMWNLMGSQYEQDGGPYVKVVGAGGSLTLVGQAASRTSAYGGEADQGEFVNDGYVFVKNSDGSMPDGSIEDANNGLFYSSDLMDSYTKEIHSFNDADLGTNPNSNAANGLQFDDSYCLYDTSSAVGGHAQTRFCITGGANGSFELDHWNGSTWVSGASLGSNQSNPSVLEVQNKMDATDGFTASTINGEITVDGSTYQTLNQAWSAALDAANTSGQNQTIRLGPGQFAVTAMLTEPTNGTCVSLIGSAGSASASDLSTAGTTLTASAALGDAVLEEGNTAQAHACTLENLNILVNQNAAHGIDFAWFRSLLLNNVDVNDSTDTAIQLGEGDASTGHQSNFLMRNVVVSYSSQTFTPASRPEYGIHLEKTAMDSSMSNIMVRNARIASIFNEGTGNTGYLVHGFGYPYACATAPCNNDATSSSSPNASYATNYVVYDVGGGGSDWSNTYIDSPAIAGFYVGANGVEIDGGRLEWPNLTSYPEANLAYVAANVTNNLLIADISCLGMSATANWITYANSSGTPPSFSSVHHLTGCGNYYQALDPAVTTAFSSGGANINDPSGSVPRVWATPLSASANEAAYSAQMYTGYMGDAYQAHFSGVEPFFNVTYDGTIRANGGLALSTVINTASTLALTTANRTVIANASSGAQALTLPSCYTPMADRMKPTGLELTIIKSDTSSNPVTLQTVSSQQINYQGVSATTLTINAAGARTLVCGPDNNWYAY